MGTQETARTAEARGGGMEPITITSNDSPPVLFGPTGALVIRAPQPPKKVGIWGQIRLHIDPVSKLVSTLWSVLLVAWSTFLLVGGLFFLCYYWTIGFIPELDLKASATLLTVSAITGSLILLALGTVLLYPAIIWIFLIRSTHLKEFWYDNEGKLLRVRVLVWLVVPLCGVLVCAIVGLLLVVYEVRWGSQGGVGWRLGGSWLVGLLVSGGITVACLRRKLGKQGWKAIGLFIANFVGTNLFFFFVFSIVFLVMNMSAFSEVTATEGIVKFTLVLLLVLVLDLMITTMFSDNFHQQPLRNIVNPIIFSSMLILIISSFMGLTRGLPNWIMYEYKFGFIRNSLLILDDVGCTIVEGHGFKEKLKVLEKDKCQLSGVMIYSRLGSTYYVGVDGNHPLMRFTIPTQHVLSWAVTESKKPTTTETTPSTQNPSSTTGLTPMSP